MFGTESGQLDRAGAVVQNRLLAEIEGFEQGFGVVEVLAIGRVDFDRADERDETQDEECREQEYRKNGGDPAAGTTALAMCAGSIASTAFASGETGLHRCSQDSIRWRSGHSSRPAGVLDEPVRLNVTMKEQVAR